MNSYSYYIQEISGLRYPKFGWLDLTYRCNNHCRHCWVWQPDVAATKKSELKLDDFIRIADDARRMGCNQWSISGGEPLLRPDFPEIFDYLTRKSVYYSLNTNGFFISPAIAKLLTRKGKKMIVMYGADAKVHDSITRNSGSFDGFLKGCAYLKEARAGFSIQIMPMRGNYHQLGAMFRLAEKLSPNYRIGASWLYLSANREQNVNHEIVRQRLNAQEVVKIDPAPPYCFDSEKSQEIVPDSKSAHGKMKPVFESCIMERNEFHIDPYGTMSFCPFIKEPSMRFDLKNWSFQDIWDKKLPQRAKQVFKTKEFRENCGSCQWANTCHWCPAFAYLEEGRFSAPIKYLCEIAKERLNFNKLWFMNNRRYFQLAEMVIQVDSDLPFKKDTFAKKFDFFITAKSEGDRQIYINHHFALPDLSVLKNARLRYKKVPWEIYQLAASWIYVSGSRKKSNHQTKVVVISNEAHTRVDIYHRDDYIHKIGNWGSLTTLPSDQIVLSRILADRGGCFFHSAGIVLNGHGILFVGPSRAGKSTMLKILKNYGEILCDDRMIVQQKANEFQIHGTWSHGEIPIVSNASAPLKAILILEKSTVNRLVRIADKKQIIHKLLFRVVRPFLTADWWEKTITLLSLLADRIPVYRFYFTKDARPIYKLEDLVGRLTSREPVNSNDLKRTKITGKNFRKFIKQRL